VSTKGQFAVAEHQLGRLLAVLFYRLIVIQPLNYLLIKAS